MKPLLAIAFAMIYSRQWDIKATHNDGDLWEFIVTPASVADITALRNMSLDLPENVVLFADRAYNHYAFEDQLAQDAKISLITQRKLILNVLTVAL